MKFNWDIRSVCLYLLEIRRYNFVFEFTKFRDVAYLPDERVISLVELN